MNKSAFLLGLQQQASIALSLDLIGPGLAMSSQTDELVSGFPSRTLTPSRPLAAATAVVGVPVGELHGRKREEVVPVHHTAALAASASPSPECALLPPPACL